MATGLAAIEPLLGPEIPCGQSYQPELHRLRGELLLERDGLAAAGEALARFQQSMQLGREMGALAWELRAAMSLVRLRKRQGEAYAAELAKARSFCEGFVRALYRRIWLSRLARCRSVDRRGRLSCLSPPITAFR